MIAGNGRALLRQSGTEPVIRVMIESESTEQCMNYADIIVEAILKGGHGVE
jgi:phosphoglucosamine mutase